MSKMAAFPLRLAVGGEVISLVGGEPIGLFVAISGELYEYVAFFTFHGVAPFEFFSAEVKKSSNKQGQALVSK